MALARSTAGEGQPWAAPGRSSSGRTTSRRHALSSKVAREQLFVVRLERGGPWDWSRGMREQDGWDEHAKFMDDLVDEGVIVLGGPLEGDRETMHVIDAPSEDAIRERFATDPWWVNGMLRPVRIERWEILLDARG